MKRSTLIRRLMLLSMVSEVLYLLLVTVVFIFRPAFYTNAIGSIFHLNVSELPVNDPDLTLAIFLYGSVAVFFIVWFVMKLFVDADSDPFIMGLITFLLMPVSVILNTYMFGRALNDKAKLGTEIFAFYSADFTVLKYCGWLTIAGFIFMLMGYSVARQRFADLD